MRYSFSLIFILITLTSSAQELLPTSTTEQIYRHTHYTLSYSESDEQAEWVYYVLTPELIRGKQSRTDDYRADSLISTVSAQLEDYRGSGYDRGHLCPAGDMKMNLKAMRETFYLSNMSPQDREFNAGIWNTQEEQVRRWALQSGKLYVGTGPILKEIQGKIGRNEVSIPKYYYKVVYDPRKQKMIAFIMPNENCMKPLQEFVVSVDSVESMTGIDFFPELHDTIENLLESQKELAGWLH